jgi:phosphoglycolate phosphatase
LADSFNWFTSHINIAARRYSFKEITEEDIPQLRNSDTQMIMKFLCIPWWKVPFVARYMRRLMNEDLHSIQLFPGVEDLLSELSKIGVKVAVVSSNSLVNVKAILGKSSEHVTRFECGVSMFGKSSRYKKILNDLRVKSDEVLCVGDEVRDIIAARKVHLNHASVGWGYAHEEILKKFSPHFHLLEVQEILSVVKGQHPQR